MRKSKKEKYRYLIVNLLKGFAWLAVIGIVFFVFKTYLNDWYMSTMEQIANKPILVLSVFVVSEVMFGIIPPELFMIWSLHQGSMASYVYYASLLAGISYVAGGIGYGIGYQFSHSSLYAKIRERFGDQFEKNVKRYGGFMVFIAAVTPIPFSAICMIAGASRYPFLYFVLISISRLMRFAVYAYAIWAVDSL